MQSEADYSEHWNEKFSTREWGRYPPEELVRFMGRFFRHQDRSAIEVLEVGCGPGANVWFLHREGYRVAGIDASAAAIEKANHRIAVENNHLKYPAPDLRVGNISRLPWEANRFDVVIDIFAVYANTSEVIDRALAEVYRVLKPGGRFFAKLWGTRTTGFGQGRQLEPHTYDEIPAGPCRDMGIAHFFDEAEISRRFAKFQIDAVDVVLRSDSIIQSEIEELVCQCTKPVAG